ncbi:DUF3016 domain-containing protein [Variovorax ginsengisoli]|jgi:hypothetical protein|uniref:DUF3016 domain-containing protein n=1 Tax=Variovorax ginsengisoli TaxID=363844 RepID=A0ABT8RVZ6_9BURK|nr:DUF3016 domain-containing protein [Variovorax ginsengisoli]MDN8611539.1 DUF3016 domain-containing protein [Variovorax ginsengisoli]MDO1530709.1 DUF3016 domain-containing protein [Variovorax ginsengisoli]
MPRLLVPTLAALLVAGASAQATAPALSVVFVHPERFTDAAYSHPNGSEPERLEVMRDVQRHLVQLAERGLPPGDSLRIEVLNIDLAGWFEPWRFRLQTGTYIRILRDITWPRMRLHYTLTRGDRVLADADDELSNLNYLMTVNRYSPTDRLRYEKAMMDDWFDRRIVARASQD